MQKIMIIGCSGAGKSVFARKLRDITGLPLYYLDQIWHKPDKTNITREEFDARLSEIVQKACWIIDGNYQRTLEVRLRACDTVILLDYPTEVCLAGAAARVGTVREDLPWVEDVFDEEFRQWISEFRKDVLPKIYDLLSKYENEKEILIFKSRAEADAYLNEVLV